MATETRGSAMPEGADIPEGCRIFRVTGTTIRDSTDTYCADGDWAVLTKGAAKHYLNLRMIRVELPEDFENATQPATTSATVGSNQSQAKP